MKSRLRTNLRVSQRQIWKRKVVAVSLITTVVAFAVFVSQNLRPEKAYAETCENAYVLNWADTTTWDVTCGDVNAGNWSVKGTTCFYYSPLFTASGTPGGPMRELVINVRINQSGNLDNNDTAWVYTHVNGSIQDTTRFTGSGSPAVFIMADTLQIPSGGTYMVSVKLKNDRTNELWQVKNGDVTFCLRPMNPLPITLTSFSAKTNADNQVQLEWITQTEINNDYFTIEHSIDAREFKPLNVVKGSGNSRTPKHYSYLDTKPAKGDNYYRLLQTDYDGTLSMYKTVFAKAGSGIQKSQTLSVSPNPFTSEFNVTLDSEIDQQVTLRLVSMSGTSVYTEVLELQEGSNRKQVLLPGRIAPGIYSLQVSGPDGFMATAKVVCR
jgi:hypothetical protein